VQQRDLLGDDVEVAEQRRRRAVELEDARFVGLPRPSDAISV
jgi:hypothetical protein